MGAIGVGAICGAVPSHRRGNESSGLCIAKAHYSLTRCVKAFATDHHAPPRLGFACNPLDVAPVRQGLGISACYASVALTLIKAAAGRSGISRSRICRSSACHVLCKRFSFSRGARVSQGFTMFAGTANPAFAAAIACELGVFESPCSIDRFPDGEVEVQLLHSVRRKEVFLLLVVSPDVGRMRVASRYAECVGVPLTMLYKQRLDGAETDVTDLVGKLADRPCLIVDDMVSTGGTIEASINALLAAGARPEISVAATNGLFVQDARRKLSHTGVKNVFVTDSIPLRECQEAWPQLHVISVALLLAGAIRRIVADGSLHLVS